MTKYFGMCLLIEGRQTSISLEPGKEDGQDLEGSLRSRIWLPRYLS